MEVEYLQSLIFDLIFFIDNHRTFKGKTVDDIIDCYEKTGNITQKQIQTLLDIYEKWKVSEYIQIKQYRQLKDFEEHI